jgi:hypothetical protein
MVQAKHIAASLAAVLIVACFASTGETATRLEPPSAVAKVTIEPRGRAYLFRGMAGLIDWGMDELAQRINRTGVTATVNTYLMWRLVANQAISDYRRDPEPITLIGHSMGGDCAIAFAEYLNAADIPVSLLVTYDPSRFAGDVPPNVERYINLYQSYNILGGGNVVEGHRFHGHYASFNLKNHHEIVHVNMEKAEYIQEQLVTKVAQLAATPANAEGEAVPVRFDVPPGASIELWDSGLLVAAHAGDTLQRLAATYHVPLWALAQVNPVQTPAATYYVPLWALARVNRVSQDAALTEGQLIIVPRHLVPMPMPTRSRPTR